MKKNNVPLNFTEKHKTRISLICAIVTMILLCLLVGKIDSSIQASQEKAAQEAEAAAKAEAEAAKQAETPKITANILASGVSLYESNIISSGQDDSGNWNYDKLYEKIKSKISSADLAIVQQKSIFTDNHDNVSGTSPYASPTEAGDALVNAGFDVIAASSNHADDYGSDYITQTLNYWNGSHSEATVLGLHSTQEDANTVKTVDVNGIKIALLNYSYGSYSGNLTDENNYMVDYFHKDKVTADIAAAKEASDCIILVAQWGDSENAVPTEYEKQWSRYLMEQGVDVVIGGHPQVLQPYETLTDEQGNEMLVFYSLGNFTANPSESSQLLGGLAEFTLEKTETDGQTNVKVTASTVTPTVMHSNTDTGEQQVYLLSDYTSDLAQANTIHYQENPGNFTPESLQKLFDHIMGLSVTPSTSLDLVDMVYLSDGSMEKSDGSILSTEEVYNINSPATEGSPESLANVLNSVSSDGTSDQGDGTSTDGDTSYDSDPDYDSGNDSSYDSGNDSSYDSDY